MGIGAWVGLISLGSAFRVDRLEIPAFSSTSRTDLPMTVRSCLLENPSSSRARCWQRWQSPGLTFAYTLNARHPAPEVSPVDSARRNVAVAGRLLEGDSADAPAATTESPASASAPAAGSRTAGPSAKPAAAHPGATGTVKPGQTPSTNSPPIGLLGLGPPTGPKGLNVMAGCEGVNLRPYEVPQGGSLSFSCWVENVDTVPATAVFACQAVEPLSCRYDPPTFAVPPRSSGTTTLHVKVSPDAHKGVHQMRIGAIKTSGPDRTGVTFDGEGGPDIQVEVPQVFTARCEPFLGPYPADVEARTACTSQWNGDGEPSFFSYLQGVGCCWLEGGVQVVDTAALGPGTHQFTIMAVNPEYRATGQAIGGAATIDIPMSITITG